MSKRLCGDSTTATIDTPHAQRGTILFNVKQSLRSDGVSVAGKILRPDTSFVVLERTGTVNNHSDQVHLGKMRAWLRECSEANRGHVENCGSIQAGRITRQMKTCTIGKIMKTVAESTAWTHRKRWVSVTRIPVAKWHPNSSGNRVSREKTREKSRPVTGAK